MSAQTVLAELQSAIQSVVGAWPVFTAGLACGLLTGFLLGAVVFRRSRATRKPGVIHSLLSITPAVVACLLWGLWLGILAAKSLAR